MDGLNRALGIGPTVFFDGRTCVVRPRTESFYGLVDAEILKRRGAPIKAVIQAASELRTDDNKPDVDAIRALADGMVSAARTYRNVTRIEHQAFMETWSGIALEFWFCLRDNFDATWTMDRVRWVLQEGSRQAFNKSEEMGLAWHRWLMGLKEAIDIAGGEDLLGNLTGLRLPTGATSQESAASSEPSVKSTDTPPEKSAT